mgnify:CR=1 FL=1
MACYELSVPCSSPTEENGNPKPQPQGRGEEQKGTCTMQQMNKKGKMTHCEVNVL